MLHQRHYTADQANDILPVVRVLVRRLQAAKRTLTTEGFDTGFAALAEVSGGAYGGRTRAEAVVMAALGFEELEELDVVVRDLEAGGGGLPAPRGGRGGLLLVAGGRPGGGARPRPRARPAR